MKLATLRTPSGTCAVRVENDHYEGQSSHCGLQCDQRREHARLAVPNADVAAGQDFDTLNLALDERAF